MLRVFRPSFDVVKERRILKNKSALTRPFVDVILCSGSLGAVFEEIIHDGENSVTLYKTTFKSIKTTKLEY